MSSNTKNVSVPTVDQIAKDSLTQISYRYWYQLDEAKPLESFDLNLIEDIYLNELVETKYLILIFPLLFKYILF